MTKLPLTPNRSSDSSTTKTTRQEGGNVAIPLLERPDYAPQASSQPVIGKISQETLADMIGTTRSRVSVFMNKFRKLGFIDYNGDLVVHNSLLNVVLHDNPAIGSGDQNDE